MLVNNNPKTEKHSPCQNVDFHGIFAVKQHEKCFVPKKHINTPVIIVKVEKYLLVKIS